MLPHLIPLPHRSLQPWMKLSKCIIQNSKNHYIQVIHAYFTTYIHIHDTQMSLSLEAIDRPANQLILDVKSQLIKNQTH
jgi:hypothetical protein